MFTSASAKGAAPVNFSCNRVRCFQYNRGTQDPEKTVFETAQAVMLGCSGGVCGFNSYDR